MTPPVSDPALPLLAEACDGARMRELLEERLRAAPGGEELSVAACHVRYFKWKPGVSARLAYEAPGFHLK